MFLAQLEFINSVPLFLNQIIPGHGLTISKFANLPLGFSAGSAPREGKGGQGAARPTDDGNSARDEVIPRVRRIALPGPQNPASSCESSRWSARSCGRNHNGRITRNRPRNRGAKKSRRARSEEPHSKQHTPDRARCGGLPGRYHRRVPRHWRQRLCCRQLGSGPAKYDRSRPRGPRLPGNGWFELLFE